ncbi:hypothetical protein TNCV_4980442 [Trichonephila clavipes]|nr:hypothetical protein TNCV_4980442 [Trichonephila clavipes]
MELDETAKARYDEKLSCNGNKLPDPFDQSTMEHCSFRLGEVCSHVAALLFAVEMANNESPAPTSVACMWNKTSKKEHNPDAPYLEDLTDEEETSSVPVKQSIRKKIIFRELN